jgi:hypothetical protein
MNIIYLGIAVVVVLILLVVVVKVLSPRKDWEHLGVEHCGSVCPNSGACDDCDCGFP